MENSGINLRNDMIANAKAYNKYLQDSYFDNKTLAQIICFTHPIDRGGFNTRHRNLYGYEIKNVFADNEIF